MPQVRSDNHVGSSTNLRRENVPIVGIGKV
jgi:hypothetical protein